MKSSAVRDCVSFQRHFSFLMKNLRYWCPIRQTQTCEPGTWEGNVSPASPHFYGFGAWMCLLMMMTGWSLCHCPIGTVPFPNIFGLFLSVIFPLLSCPSPLHKLWRSLLFLPHTHSSCRQFIQWYRVASVFIEPAGIASDLWTCDMSLNVALLYDVILFFLFRLLLQLGYRFIRCSAVTLAAVPSVCAAHRVSDVWRFHLRVLTSTSVPCSYMLNKCYTIIKDCCRVFVLVSLLLRQVVSVVY